MSYIELNRGEEGEAVVSRVLPGLRLEVAKIFPRPGSSLARSLERFYNTPDRSGNVADRSGNILDGFRYT